MTKKEELDILMLDLSSGKRSLWSCSREELDMMCQLGPGHVRSTSDVRFFKYEVPKIATIFILCVIIGLFLTF